MRTILLHLEYDGTAYFGWQIQPDRPTVQNVVESALKQVIGCDLRIHSSSRTDAGVHARDMAVHFRTECGLPLTAFREGANAFLPDDVVIRAVREMPEDFHARYSSRGKWYRYTIYNAEVRSPLTCRTSWHLRGHLDRALMQEAAGLLVGEHDFRAFRTTGCVARSTVREIYQVDVTADHEFIYLDFRGSGFLRNMVRMLVGTLVEIGQGKRPLGDMEKLLKGEAGLTSGATAPARGLCLQKVWY